MRSAFGLLAACGAAFGLATASLAGCPNGQREFRGSISQINAGKLFVDSRLDDNIGFERSAETRVLGGSRKSWDELRVGDQVAICWRFEDRPRKVVTITVK